MPHLESFDGTSLFFDDQGDGTVVLLLHGFVGDVNIDWIRSGILDRVLDEGYRTIAYDARGHGLSDKPHDAAAYSDDALERDASAVLDARGVDRCVVVGFSLGARTALRLATMDDRVQGVVALGLGAQNLQEGAGSGEAGDPERAAAGAAIGDVLLGDADAVPDGPLRHYREMADAIHADREALAALMRAPRPGLPTFVDDVTVPVLLVTGRDDPVGDPVPLAASFADAQALTTAGDHAGVKDQPDAHEAIVTFLQAHA